MPTAPESTDWPEFAPPVALSDGSLGAVQGADREIARQTAVRARAVAEFAATRSATADRAQGEPGAMSAERWHARPEILRPVSEWAGRELVVALSISAEADALLTRSLNLVHRLPGTLAALEAGALHPGHLWTMLEKVAPIDDGRIRAEVEAEVLRWAAGRVVTPAQLSAKVRREAAGRDARAAVRQLEKALKERGIHLRPHAVDGMGVVTVVATMPEAQALHRALIACAEALEDDGDPRTRGQKALDCLLDLVLRPGETDVPPVQVLLTIVASLGTVAGGDAPGEIDGQLVPAEMIRQLLAALTARQQSVPGDSGQAGEGLAAASIPWQEAEQEELSRWWAEMERRILAGELVDPDRHADHHPPEMGGDACPPEWLFDDGPEPPEQLFDEASWPPEWLLDEYSGSPETTPGPADSYERACPPDGVAPTAAELAHVTSTGVSAPCETGPAEPTGHELPAEDAGWWAAADEAVDDASLALFRSGQKLAHARWVVRTAAAADDADEAAWQAGPPGRLNDAGDAITALLSATDAQRTLLADLLATTAGGGLADRPRIALTDALSGALLALTDLPGMTHAAPAAAPRAGDPLLGASMTSATDPRWVRPTPPMPIGPRRNSTAGCVPATDAVDSQAAVGASHGVANSTTIVPTQPARPAPRTSWAIAPPTIGASTRHPAGSTSSIPTAPSPSPRRPVSSPSPAHPRTDCAEPAVRGGPADTLGAAPGAELIAA